MGFCCHITECFGNIFLPDKTQYANDKIAQSGHHTRAGLDILAIPIKMGDLTAMGKKNKVINFSAGPNFTNFQTAMSFFDSLGIRG